jgi:microcystin synthetase protein McyG
LVARFPAAKNEIEMIRRCGSRLTEILQGFCDPLEILFPEDEPITAASLYSDSPGARAANGVIERVFADYVRHQRPGHRLRVLEIGGGTGGTTDALMSCLSGVNLEYTFTDVSMAFLSRARERFSQYDFIDYRVLDLEKAPSQQGFSGMEFDVVLAANVLHATRNLEEGLGHIRELLAPNGMLVLLEGTAPLRFIDFIFGLTDGWWRFSDRTLRPNHPLLAARKWLELLSKNGFCDASSVTPEEPAGFFANQAIIVARCDVAPTGRDPREHWMIFADSQGLGERIAEEVSGGSMLCTVVLPSTGYEVLNDKKFYVNPDAAEDYVRLLHDAETTRGLPVGWVLHLWALDTPEVIGSADLDHVERLGCSTVMNLVQALARAEFDKAPSLLLVTRGAHGDRAERTVSGLFQTTLLGMSRAITLEHPELSCVCVDLDPANLDLGDEARLIVEEVRKGNPEALIAYNGQIRKVARLARWSSVDDQPRSIQFRADATYLITGGMSGLGMLVAKWMAGRGAKNLALMARSGLNETSRTELRNLESLGESVTFFQGDVSDACDVQRALKTISDSMPPLRGIVHSAGVLADGALVHQDWQRFSCVMKPKMDGAWHLHRFTLNQSLDFFVLFSSAAALLGSPAQANHSAANSFLDGLAHYRRSKGLPALSINWGAWSAVGSAASPSLGARLATHGMGTISPEQGLDVLEYLMLGSTPQVGVIPYQWPAVLGKYASGDEPRFFSWIVNELRERAVRNAGPKPATLDRCPDNASSAEREMWLRSYLTEKVAASLGVDPKNLSTSKPLNHMGLDSLMAIEIRNRLKADVHVEISVVKLLAGASIAGLASDLAPSLAPMSGNVHHELSDAITPATAGTLLADIDRLSDKEIDAILLSGTIASE